MTAPRWHVLGPGAIGCLFAVGLHDAGCPVTLVAREAPSPTVELSIENNGQARALRLPVCGADDAEPVSHLLVTTKAYDVAAAVTSVAHRLTPAGEVLVLANGMGFAEELAAACPGVVPYFGTTTEGAYRSSPFRIHHAGRGSTLIGRSGQATPPDWFDAWQRVTADCRWEPAIDQALWRKLAVNCAINPLTAVYDCRNGDLMTRKTLRERVDQLCREIATVSDAAGFATVAATLRDSVDAVIRATAANYSSMQQDLRAGRRTEIDYITGYLLRIAARHRVPAPHNRALLEEVSRLGHRT